MFDIAEIDRELADLEKRFEEGRERLAEEYAKDRDALLSAREYAIRRATHVPPFSYGISPNGRLSPTRQGKTTDRQLIREFLARWSGDFTISDLVLAAKRSGNAALANIEKNVWPSTMHWLAQNGLVETVERRKGNQPGKYRVRVSPTDMIAPRKQKRRGGSPVQDIVIESIKLMPVVQFRKNELVEAVCRNHPKQDPEVIGATLHRLASHNVGARIAERNRKGNVYEKL